MEAYERLEKKYGEFCEREHMVVCSSGTAALHLCLEVVRKLYSVRSIAIPDFTMIACARAASMAEFDIDFRDVDYLGLLDYEYLTEEMETDVSAVMQVHTYGRRCGWSDAKSVYSDTIVINDAAEAHGLKFRPSEYVCWSFYRNKVIAGEEGGAIAFTNKEEADLARQLRNMGFTLEHNFNHIPRGFNYRLSNCHANLILRSLRNYEYNIARRHEVEKWYNLYIPEEWYLPPRNVPWVYDVNLASVEEVNIDNLVQELNHQGVPARCAFKPLSQQLEYKHLGYYNKNTEHLSRTRLYLPITPNLTKEQVRVYCSELERVVEEQEIKAPT